MLAIKRDRGLAGFIEVMLRRYEGEQQTAKTGTKSLKRAKAVRRKLGKTKNEADRNRKPGTWNCLLSHIYVQVFMI